MKKIGLVYASTNDKRDKNCPFSLWLPLFSLPGLQWYSIQKGEAAAELGNIAATQDNFIDLSAHIRDFGDTAALLDQLDLLISIDTSVRAYGRAHWANPSGC